jgi:Domain of unknown function (DUF5666)
VNMQFIFGKNNSVMRWTLYSTPFALAACVLIWTACGGGGTSSGGRGGTPTTSNSQIKIGDAPTDGVVSFELTINSITLTPAAGGNPVAILSTPASVELTHSSATFEPLAVANIPVGSYSGATLTVASPEVAIINSTTRQPQQLTAVLASPNVTINLATPIAITPSASVLLFDLNLANSVTIGGGVATVAPSFTVQLSSIAAQNQQDDETGEIEDITGVVTGVSGSSFTISVAQSASPLTFATDSATQFEAPLANATSIQTGMVLEVDAVTQSNGALLATKVEAEEVASGLDVEGFVITVTGSPATQFQMVVHESASSAANPPALGSVLTVNIDGNTNFRIDDNHVDLSGLTVNFDATLLSPGQEVEVDVDPPVAATPTADKLTLKQQSLNGTISNFTPTGTSTAVFTLTVDPVASAFALVSNQSTLTVFRQPGTELKNLTSLTNGQSIRVRGLVFFDTATSSFTMVAGRITP